MTTDHLNGTDSIDLIERVKHQAQWAAACNRFADAHGYLVTTDPDKRAVGYQMASEALMQMSRLLSV